MINIAVVGNGNLGRACKAQILRRDKEFRLVGGKIFSRRKTSDAIFIEKLYNKKDVDVVLFCGGTKTDAIKIVPDLTARGFSTVDSYDNHAEIKNCNYINAVQDGCTKGRSIAIIGAGWDPGYLSLQRIMNLAIMPGGAHNTLYGGKSGGKSMGHTNVIREIPGVIHAHQITQPREEAKQKALNGEKVNHIDAHRRLCYVVCDKKDEACIEEKIRDTKDYFKGYEVHINFISEQEFMDRFESANGHGGQVISVDNNASIDLQLEMKSNPDLTASVMIAYAVACHRLKSAGHSGVYTVAQIPPALLVCEETHLSEI